MALILHRSSLLNLYEIVKPLEKSTLIKTLILVSPNTLESALPFGHPMPPKKYIIYIFYICGFESALSAYIYKEKPPTKLHVKGEEVSVL